MSALTFTAGEVEAASGVLIASALNLEQRGEALWPTASLTPERLLRHYPADSWRVAWQDGRAVGCYSLLSADPLFWPDDSPGTALYLHKLAVHPDWQGRQLARDLLREALREARERRVTCLKLDTATGRPKLRAIYEQFGFLNVGRRDVKGFDVTLYQYLL